ncbi:MAG: hypothetical protein KAT32_01655, partial [Candidatus Moranbacteria bacterium]|nr:hypothetical protein [Candidatus Moranbacteria bacterium]
RLIVEDGLLINSYTFYLFPLIIFIFCFLAWLKLKKKLENKVDYEITYKIEYLSKIDFKEKETEYEIEILKKELKEEKDKFKKADLENHYNNLGTKISKNNNSKISALKSFLNDVKKYRKQNKNLYHIRFFINNIGNKSDKNIHCKLLDSENNRIIDYEKSFDIVYSKPKYPEFNKGFYVPSNIKSKSSFYREKLNNFCFELGPINAGEKNIEIFYPGYGVLVKGDDFIEFNFEIDSENLKGILKRNIKIKLKNFNPVTQPQKNHKQK